MLKQGRHTDEHLSCFPPSESLHAGLRPQCCIKTCRDSGPLRFRLVSPLPTGLQQGLGRSTKSPFSASCLDISFTLVPLCWVLTFSCRLLLSFFPQSSLFWLGLCLLFHLILVRCELVGADFALYIVYQHIYIHEPVLVFYNKNSSPITTTRTI